MHLATQDAMATERANLKSFARSSINKTRGSNTLVLNLQTPGHTEAQNRTHRDRTHSTTPKVLWSLLVISLTYPSSAFPRITYCPPKPHLQILKSVSAVRVNIHESCLVAMSPSASSQSSHQIGELHSQKARLQARSQEILDKVDSR